MEPDDSLSSRRILRFWGWGYADEKLSAGEQQQLDQLSTRLMPGGWHEVAAPRLAEFDLTPSRLPLPNKLSRFVSALPYDRLVHTYGKSYADMARMFLRDARPAPDLVAFPRDEEDICALFDFAAEQGAALIPFGGGTSVCGGVEADVSTEYAGTISLDMQHFDQVLDVCPSSRSATVQAGMFGPDLETALKPHGLTLRHYPQSFMFSTVGGWIATRAGGHFATLYTHIDDLVSSTRTLTPQGAIESRRLPGSGAGPSADRLILGSEGTLGVITQASLRLQNRPRWKAGVSVHFAALPEAVEAVRIIAQSGLYPSNCRLLDPNEVVANQLAPQSCALLVLGFESADHPVCNKLDRALEIARACGGRWEAGQLQDTTPEQRERRDEQAGAWRQSFIRMPYYRNLLTGRGIIADTFETAVTWDKFESFHQAVMGGIQKAITEASGRPGFMSCRFTHVYPDGPAPYYTFYAVGSDSGDLERALNIWRSIKHAANRLVVEHGGTITHHHAVGRDHRDGYEAQTSALFRSTLSAAKQELDPRGLLNPGVLIDPKGQRLGQRGVLRVGSAE